MPKKKGNWATRLKVKVQRRFRAKQRMAKETAKQERYAKHYKAAGPKHAMTYAEWSKKGEQPTYFKGIKRRTVEAQLREAGVTGKETKRLLRR